MKLSARDESIIVAEYLRRLTPPLPSGGASNGGISKSPPSVDSTEATIAAVKGGGGAMSGVSPMVAAIRGVFGVNTDLDLSKLIDKGQNESTRQRIESMYSHSMGRPHTDMEVFQPLTAFCKRVTDPAVIAGKVDQAIRTAITHKHPVYLEIPQAMLDANCSRPTTPLDLSIPPGAAAKTAGAILKAIKAGNGRCEYTATLSLPRRISMRRIPSSCGVAVPSRRRVWYGRRKRSGCVPR